MAHDSGSKFAGGRRQSSRLRRIVRGAGPIAVWLAAIAVAVVLARRVRHVGPLTGYAEDRTITLVNLSSGLVRDVRPRLHEEVQEGEIVARLDDTADALHLKTLQADVKRLQADVEAEAARLAMEAARQDTSDRDLARRFMVDRETAHIQYLSQLLTDANNRALLNGATFEYEIVKDLIDKKTASARELNRVRTDVDSLRAQIDENKPTIARMKQAFDDADMRWHNYVKQKREPVDYEPVLTAARLAADVREREIAEIVHRIDQQVVRAPVRGQVTALFANAGDPVIAGSPLMAISPTLTNRVIAYLPESGVASVRVGERVLVSPVAAMPGGRRSYSGQVVSMADVVSEAPPRYRKAPQWPLWGRAVVVLLDSGAALMPGEAVTLGPEN